MSNPLRTAKSLENGLEKECRAEGREREGCDPGKERWDPWEAGASSPRLNSLVPTSSGCNPITRDPETAALRSQAQPLPCLVTRPAPGANGGRGRPS